MYGTRIHLNHSDIYVLIGWLSALPPNSKESKHKSCKYYWVKKQIEPSSIHPLDRLTSIIIIRETLLFQNFKDVKTDRPLWASVLKFTSWQNYFARSRDNKTNLYHFGRLQSFEEKQPERSYLSYMLLFFMRLAYRQNQNI